MYITDLHKMCIKRHSRIVQRIKHHTCTCVEVLHEHVVVARAVLEPFR